MGSGLVKRVGNHNRQHMGAPGWVTTCTCTHGTAGKHGNRKRLTANGKRETSSTTYFARGVGIFVPHFGFDEIFSHGRLLLLRLPLPLPLLLMLLLLLLLLLLVLLLGMICLSHGDIERITGHRRS